MTNKLSQLDIVTPARHMSQTVPRVAVSSPVLKHACLFYAANCIWLRKQITTAVKDQYHDQVISRLINALATHPHPEQDEAMLATAVILRMAEQFCEISEDTKNHFKGASSLFSTGHGATKWSPYQNDLSGASFWTYVRESLRLCIMDEDQCRFDLNLIEHESSFAPASDDVWTNRSTYLLAQTFNVSFGGPTILSLEELETLISTWIDQVPGSFKPWCVRDRVFGPFPGIYFLSTWHEVGWQQIVAAKVILAVFRLKSRGLSNVLEITRYTESQILEPSRVLAGVSCIPLASKTDMVHLLSFHADILQMGMSTVEVGSQINASQFVPWCAQFFTHKEERATVLKWLDQCEQVTRWPNKTSSRRLQDIWKGRRTTWPDPTTTTTPAAIP